MEITIRILVVEDDADLARRLAEGLERIGFAVESAADGQTGYQLGRSENFDAAILDLGLPDLTGADVLKRWRQAGREMPVLILTAHGSWTEKIEALNAGADHYVTKPSHIREIAAHLFTLIRRSAGKRPLALDHKGIESSPATGS